MGQFSATLRVPGDSNALPATVDIGDGRLRVESGNHVIGNWALGDIDITQGPDGVQVSAEGEVLILDIPERAAFHEAAGLNEGKTAKPFKLPTLTRSPKHDNGHPDNGHPGNGRPSAKPKGGHTPAQPVASKEKPAAAPKKASEPIFIDRWLASGEKALGKHLPAWVFTRGGALVVLAALVVAVLLPTLVSTLLLVAGVGLLVLGGVTMLDHVLSARLLKAKVTPTQCLIAGGILVFVGVLFGMLA